MAEDDKNFSGKCGSNADLVFGAIGALCNNRPSVPSGIIVMWSGATNAVPDGWALCDGNNGTPDLRDRFIVGTGNSYAPGATGGASTATTTSDGAHAHKQAVTGATTLSVAQMPPHEHAVQPVVVSWIQGNVYGIDWTLSGSEQTKPTSSVGGGGAHTHANPDTASAGAHTHTVNTLPPFYSLAYIIKL